MKVFFELKLHVNAYDIFYYYKMFLKIIYFSSPKKPEAGIQCIALYPYNSEEAGDLSFEVSFVLTGLFWTGLFWTGFEFVASFDFFLMLCIM